MGKIKSLTAAEIAEHAELIDRLGGPTAVVAILFDRLDAEMTPQNVSNMRSRGIPDRYRPCLAIAASDRNIGVPQKFINPGKRPKPRNEEVPFL